MNHDQLINPIAPNKLLVSELTHQSEENRHAQAVGTAAAHKINLNQFASMMENIPINVIMADLDLKITYMNPASIKQLNFLQHLLPVPVENMIGVSIDLFHKNPDHQRRLLSTPSNLPHSTHIQLGEETLDLLVTAVLDDEGNYIGPMVTWEVISEKLKIQNEFTRVQNMMENLPINVMMANRDHELVYMNATSAKTLKQLEHLLPKPFDELIGAKIDIFHKNPEMNRRLLSNPSNLPHSAKIQLGEDFLQLDISAIYDKDNQFIGPMVCWEVITDHVKLTNEVMNGVKIVSTSAVELQASSKSMAASSEETSRQAQVVAAASEEATRNVETVSSATEQLSASISEISRHVQDASDLTSKAVEEADSTNNTIEELSRSSDEIGRVTKMIASIAQQTNLLSLNATIEAARAGEVGKGFAVVANEVKELAHQSAKASKEISQKIDGIQSSTAFAVNAISSIRNTIGKINEISTTIAGAVEEQAAATKEISRNVSEAAQGTAEVTENIAGVSQAANESGKSSTAIFTSADALSQEAVRLEKIVKEYIGE